jgi:hypothetical protein
LRAAVPRALLPPHGTLPGSDDARANVNHLYLGSDKSRILDNTEPGALLIDDGPLVDDFVQRFRAKVFDPAKHSFNPLAGIDHKRARDIARAIYSADPQAGQSTLTVRNGRRALARMLLAAGRLDKLTGDSKDPAVAEALGTVDDLLFSPVVRQVLCGRINFRPGKASIVARLDRAELGEEEALILALLLIGQHQGQVIVPDFGFYGRPLHMSLIRQGRLTAGLNALSDLGKPDDKLRQAMLTIKDKHGAGCLYEDALELAKYLCPFLPGQDGHTGFVQRLMGHP